MKFSVKKFLSLIIKHTSILCLFAVLPLVATLFLGHEIINIEQNKNIIELSTKLDNTLKDIESEISEESFLLKVARGAWYTYNKNSRDYDHFWNYYNKLCRYLKSEPDLYLFNENGKIVNPQSQKLKSRFLASKLWVAIDSSYEEKENIVSKYKKQFKSFLGNEFTLGIFLDNCNQLIPIILNAETGYLYWVNSTKNPKEGILMIFWNTPSFDFRMSQILKRYSSELDDFFIMNSQKEIQTFFNNKKNKSQNYKNIYTKTVHTNHKDYYADTNSRLWRFTEFGNISLLACSKSNSNLFASLKLFYNLFISFLSIVILLFYFWAIKQNIGSISIRTKLITIFLIAVLTPVLGFTFLGYQYISDIRDNLRNQIRNESRKILLNIDRELGNSGNVFRDDFKKMVQDFQHYDEDEKIRKFFKESIRNNDLVEIDRRLASDASLIKQLVNNVTFESLNVFTDPFSKCCIDVAYNKNLMDGVDPVIKNAMLSPEGSMASFWDRPDNVQDFVFGPNEFYLYWCISKTEKYGDEYFFIFRNYNKVMHDHLQQRLEQCKTNPIEKDYLIYAFNNRKEEWFPNNSFEANLKSYSKRIKYMGKPIETEININSKDYLLVGITGGKLRGYSLYALYPYENIRKKVLETTYYILVCIFLFFVIAISIGYMISNVFLNPVKQLEKGVNAINTRNTQFRMALLQNDEFGDLAESFNKVIGNLKEIELAKYIQEALLPKKLPQIDGYEISSSNKMASGIGGDYFDTVLLDENNLCIIIGDVSGHGVASALIMAIAKAVFYHGFNKKKNLIDLFSDLNSVINTYFGKPPVKKMITLFATIIDLPSGKGIFLDAGHNYPMKISENGQITELKMAGLPVGIMKKLRKQKIDEFTFNPGETIVFYTDGIVEATGKTTEQYGYERFKKNLTEITKEDSETIKNKLLENYNNWKDGTEPDDDVTLVVLKRLSS